ncbi:MAG: hypothetical protein AAB262_07195 [Elusimicrobiota bacterium]
MLAVPCIHSQEDEDVRAGLSRPMRGAIDFYEQGEDTQAMDGFMDILARGNPTERSMANEYLNLITHRMNTGGAAQGAPTQAPVPARRPPAAQIVPEDEAAPSRRGARPDSIDEPEAPARRSAPAATPVGERDGRTISDMRKEIRARLRAAQQRSVSDLKELEGVRVVMREDGNPEAIGIPSSMLFQAGIAFQRNASRLLDPLTKLVFSLGSAQVLILPEGTALADAKVLDMRRTMGISSHFYQAGVAPPRVRVNLLNTQVDIPKGLQDFKGVVIVFQFNQPMNLVVDGAVGDELGPPISMGVYPNQIRPARNQGAIIEFSVSDPPAGLVSWKFQLLQPSRDGSELAPLQEVVGSAPVFHQIFWNGRLNYFGPPLSAGRYECVLSALDAKKRQRTLHRWISVLDDGASSGKLLAAPAAERAARPPSEDLAGDFAKPLVAGVKPAAGRFVTISKPKTTTGSQRKVVKRPVRGKKAARADKGKEAKSAQPQAEAVAGGHYKLSFNKNTHQMTQGSEKSLAQAAMDLANDPLEVVKVIGHASSDELQPAFLADRRAKMVAGLLVNRYQIEPKKIRISSSASGQGAKVELVMGRRD